MHAAARVLRMKHLLLAAIRIYQRFLSPHKGFRCAYRAHTGRASCSTLGYRAVRRHGVFGGLGLLRERTDRCGVAHRRLTVRPAALQRGDCDCDLPCDCGLADACDLFRRDKDKPGKKQKGKHYTYVPPRAPARPRDRA